MDKKTFTIPCPICKKEREVGQAMLYFIKREKTLGVCHSCSMLGKNVNHNLEKAGTKFHHVWATMKQRCLNQENPEYPRYGGRGIKICDKWLYFDGFFDDMFDSYKSNLTIDRINNNQNYCKENCRWATKIEQARNTRNVERAMRFFFLGKNQTIREWAEEFNIKRSTLYMRLVKYRMPIERAVNYSLNYSMR